MLKLEQPYLQKRQVMKILQLKQSAAVKLANEADRPLSKMVMENVAEYITTIINDVDGLVVDWH